MNKVCAKCGGSKALATFGLRRDAADGRRAECRECRADYLSGWRARNPAKIKALRAAHYAAHAERVLLANAVWRAENPETVRRAHTIWCAANPEKCRAIKSRWSAANPEKVHDGVRRRRARKHNAVGTHSSADVSLIYCRQAGLCNYCRTPLDSRYHADHRVALAAGGSDGVENIQVLCPPCNWKKGAQPEAKFLARHFPHLLTATGAP